jgi:hypothetical protein
MLAVALPVFAQEVPAAPVSVGAEGHAVELGVSGGFTDGWGTLGTGTVGHVTVPGAGGALELEPAWRALPAVAVGAYGWGAQLGQVAALPFPGYVLQAGAGVEGSVHVLPASPTLDPWFGLGTGWRGQWLNSNSGSLSQDGWEIVRARAGVDSRVTPGLALGPVIGASLTRYYTEELPGGSWMGVPHPGLDVYVFAGVRATLDWAAHPKGSALAK